METTNTKTALLKAVRSFYKSGIIFRNKNEIKGTAYKVAGINLNDEISEHSINRQTASVHWGHYGFSSLADAVYNLSATGYEPIAMFDHEGNVSWLILSL